MRLEGHVAVVTGGTGGLGRAVASAFLASGARVVATTRRPVDGEVHERLAIEAVDLLDEESMLGLAELVRERHGRCDALVCCAGGFEAGTRVAETPLATWRRLLDLNATTAFLACRALLPLMLEGRRGSIVLVGAKTALHPFPGGVPYSASKSAVVALANGARGRGARPGRQRQLRAAERHRHAGEPRRLAGRRPVALGHARGVRRDDPLAVLSGCARDVRGRHPRVRTLVGSSA